MTFEELKFKPEDYSCRCGPEFNCGTKNSACFITRKCWAELSNVILRARLEELKK